MDPSHATKCDPQYNRHTSDRFYGSRNFFPTLTVCYYSDSNYHKTLWWITRVYCYDFEFVVEKWQDPALSTSFRGGAADRIPLKVSARKKSSRINHCWCLLLSLLNHEYLHPAYPNPVPPLIIWRLVWHVASPWSAQRPFFFKNPHIDFAPKHLFSPVKEPMV